MVTKTNLPSLLISDIIVLSVDIEWFPDAGIFIFSF